MTKSPVPATVAGLPTRRGVLAALSAIGFAPAAAAAPTAAILDARETASENPALMAMGEEIDNVERAYADALGAWRQAWAEWSPQWPLAPDCCTPEHEWANTEVERNLGGWGLVRDGETEPRRVWKGVDEVRSSAEWWRGVLAKDDRRKRRASKKSRKFWADKIALCDEALVALPVYLAECERIKKASDFEALSTRRSEATKEVFAMVRRVLSEPSRTAAGNQIKARAAAVIGRMHSYDVSRGHVSDMFVPGEERPDLVGMLGLALVAVDEERLARRRG